MQVSATAFNEGSSRSHTIMRLSIESSERPGPDADPRIHVARTLSFLNLIDLAGSESAKVCCFLDSVATKHPASLPHANSDAMYLLTIQWQSLQKLSPECTTMRMLIPCSAAALTPFHGVLYDDSSVGCRRRH